MSWTGALSSTRGFLCNSEPRIGDGPLMLCCAKETDA
jgi:hypothetical protein